MLVDVDTAMNAVKALAPLAARAQHQVRELMREEADIETAITAFISGLDANMVEPAMTIIDALLVRCVSAWRFNLYSATGSAPVGAIPAATDTFEARRLIYRVLPIRLIVRIVVGILIQAKNL